ncbi:hypothetical protein [Phormidium sp. FACHB-1136]|uniref:hypothetical protein n=1 Tax=Phormidium sp. FACHB-1136 TaxID=2692848 RepID=UPI001682F8FA|nr:hypothetical protein [Phormidium sp. FACHB-1136]MBD2428398.1 hypothetical protein [Phormidium sp. FACHB-1136]
MAQRLQGSAIQRCLSTAPSRVRETGLFRSDDATRLPGDAAGATWVKVSTDQQRLSNVNYIEGDRQRFGHVYVGTGGRGIIHGQPKDNPVDR